MGQEEGGSLRAEYAYDAAGHRTKSRDGDGVEVSLSYGLEGQIRTLTTERAREAEGSPLSMPRREEKRSIPTMLPVTFAPAKLPWGEWSATPIPPGGR